MDVTKPYKSIRFGAMDVAKPYKFRGFEAREVTKPYTFIRFWAMDVTKPYEFMGSGAMDVTKPYEFMGFGALEVTKPHEFIGFGASGKGGPKITKQKKSNMQLGCGMPRPPDHPPQRSLTFYFSGIGPEIVGFGGSKRPPSTGKPIEKGGGLRPPTISDGLPGRRGAFSDSEDSGPWMSPNPIKLQGLNFVLVGAFPG